MFGARHSDLQAEYLTGDQERNYRLWRGYGRTPSWKNVEEWRSRWTKDKVRAVLAALGRNEKAEGVAHVSGFGVVSVRDERGAERFVPDLRGLDVALLDSGERSLPRAD